MDRIKQLNVFYIPHIDPFEGLFGVFADSLSDGWGRFLVDRLMLRNRIEPAAVGDLNRLAIVGESGMGHSPIDRRYH